MSTEDFYLANQHLDWDLSNSYYPILYDWTNNTITTGEGIKYPLVSGHMSKSIYIQLTDTDGGNCVHSFIITEPCSETPEGIFIPAKMIATTHYEGRLTNIRHIADEDLKEELLLHEDKWDWVHMRPIFSYTIGDERAWDIIHEDDPSDDEEEEDENPTSVQQV